MKQFLSSFAFLLLIALSLPASGQFRRERNTANQEYDLHAYHLAIENYEKALARRPKDLESLSRIADAHRMLNQMQAAHKYYQQAVLDRKVDGKTVLEHAHVLKALGRYDEAKQWYLKYAQDYNLVAGNHYAQGCDFASSQLTTDAGFSVQSINANSPVSDFGPTTPTTDQLVFSSNRTTAGASFDGKATNQPYVSVVGPDGGLQRAYLLQTGYDSRQAGIGPVSYSPDGRQVVFTRNNFTTGARLIPETGINLTLMIADVNDQGSWVNARPLPVNISEYSTGFGTFSTDGNTIYFASNRPEGYGGYDIYRTHRQGQSWESIPENLGAVVNSVGHEITPFYDGRSLFFSSNYHHGMGTYDVFRAEMASNRANQLFHMGAGVNSDRDDMGFIYDPVTSSGYVVSNRIGGSGMEDIYRVTRFTDNKTLIVQSAQDGRYLANAAVDFTACGGQVYATDSDGRYIFEPTEGLDCDITISTPGFAPVRLPLKTLTSANDNTVRITLQPATSTDKPVNRDVVTPVPGGVTPPGSYRGIITNAESGYVIPMANVRITQRSTGASANMFTNVDGTYIIALSPGATYDLKISAEGYETVTFPITITDPANQNILGNTPLVPTGPTTSQPPVAVTPSQPVTPGGGNTGQPTNPGTTGNADIPPSAPANITGYSVQLASLRQAPDLSKFNNVSHLGRVYDVNTGASHKVRLGVFNTRPEAEAAARKAQQAGYNGAFVISDSGVMSVTNTLATPNPGATPAAPSAPVVSSRYKVQIGAFGDPQNFDRSRASALGQLETRSRGNLTLFFIGNLNTLSEANSVKSRARSMGYEGAFILESVGGALRQVQ